MDFSNGCVLPQPPPLTPFLGLQPGQMLQQFPPVLNTLDAQHQQFFQQQVIPQPSFQQYPPPPPPLNHQPQMLPPQFPQQQPLGNTHQSFSSQTMQQLPLPNQFPQQQPMQQSLQQLLGQPLGHQLQAALPNQFAPQEQSLHQLLGQQSQHSPEPTHISSLPIPPPPEASAGSQVGSSTLPAEAVVVSKARSPSGHKRGSSQDRRRKSRSHSRGRKKSRSRSRDRRKSRSRSRRKSRSRSKDRRKRSRGRGSRSRGRRRSRSRDRRRSRSRSGKGQGGAYGGLDASTLSESIARAQAAAQQVKSSSGSSSWQQGQSAAPEPKNIAVDWTKIQRSQVQRDFIGTHGAFDLAEASRRRQALNITVESEGTTPGMTPMPLQSFADLPCAPHWVKQALDENKWEMPMPIQAQAFPILLAGHNLIGIAQTGSGKTVAFLLPAVIHANVQQPLRRSDPGPIVLVLAPTRELAVQISEEADKLLRYSSESTGHPGGMRSVAFYGGGKKRDQLQKFTFDGSHIVAATPGRLMDFCGEGKVSLQRVTYFCLDEADRMLELGFLGDMQQIGAAIRPERQMAFFSATWPKEVQALAMGLCLDSPVTIRVGRQGTDGSANGDDPEALVANKNITQQVVVVDFPEGKDQWNKQEAEKKRLLDEHIKAALTDQDAKMIIFVNQKNFADELSNQIWNDGIYVDAIHGGRPQEKRLESLDMFKKGRLRVLIATDVVGRGVDIPDVTHVVIYSMNGVPDYIHRIGRTARGKGTKGHALVFFEYMPKQAQTAKELIDVLEKADQFVPPELRQIQADVESGRRYDAMKDWDYSSGSWKSNNNWQSGSWK